MPLGLGSNPGEGMDTCKCIVPSRHGGTLNSGRAASPLVRLVSGYERPRPTTDVHLAPCHDESRGPRSDYVRQVPLATTTQHNSFYNGDFGEERRAFELWPSDEDNTYAVTTSPNFYTTPK
ncbi:hypothetical protein TNCV_1239781 [Trichonephila clavipes]|nr:hypothetical protein TNCV_1239781 [Trichonephila clavipes]